MVIDDGVVEEDGWDGWKRSEGGLFPVVGGEDEEEKEKGNSGSGDGGGGGFGGLSETGL